MIDYLVSNGRAMSLRALNLLLFAMAGTVAAREAINLVNSDELTALLPAVRSDSRAASEIRTHFKSREFTEVMRLSDELIQARPQSREGYFWKGAAAIQKRQFYAAVRSLRVAEKLEPPNNAVAKNLAIAYYLLDQGQLFELKMKEAVALDPDDFSPHYYLGRYYLSSVSFDVAVAAQSFARALDKKFDDAASTCFYGVALEGLGDSDQARERFVSAAHLTGEHGLIPSLAYLGLSRLTLSEEPWTALDFARKAVAAEPDSVQAQLQLAKAEAAVGDRSQQVAALHAAAALARNDARPQYQLMRIYRQMGDEGEARVAADGYQQRVSCFGREAADIR